jgi:K+ transporter
MPLPEATFLEGALLSLLLPTLLLIALTVWYVMFVRRVPESTEGGEPAQPETLTNPPESAPPDGST